MSDLEKRARATREDSCAPGRAKGECRLWGRDTMLSDRHIPMSQPGKVSLCKSNTLKFQKRKVTGFSLGRTVPPYTCQIRLSEAFDQSFGMCCKKKYLYQGCQKSVNYTTPEILSSRKAVFYKQTHTHTQEAVNDNIKYFTSLQRSDSGV